MEPMKTRTIQDVPRPPFAEWYCEIKGVTGTSGLRVKLEMMYMLRALCPTEPLPAFIADAVHAVNGVFVPSVKAITDSPKVREIVWLSLNTELVAQIHFNTGDVITVREQWYKLKKEVLATNTLLSPELEELLRVRLLRRLFRRPDFMDLI